jgi:phenylalanyl-tRNA synthetase beta chain
MKAPLSWLKDFVTIPNSISSEQIAAAFVRVGFEVEAIISQGKDLKGPLKVGKVLGIQELSGHKKPIRYVELDCGEKQSRFVICGATNFKVNDFVVVAIPGAVLPNDFKISARQTYDRTSNGMICSAKELGISDDHAGIIVLPADKKIKPGADALKLLEINETIFDIAINPDRGYAMSIRGLARELAGALNLKFNDPVLNSKLQKYPLGDRKKSVSVKIEDKSGADSIYLRTVTEVKCNQPSPLFMQRRIQKAGMRPISLAVDITNYVMLELGQPLHAFDAEKLFGAIRVTRAKNFKNLTTLDGQKRSLNPHTLLIADSEKPLALAGVMGGIDSEVNPKTRTIAIEAAHFIPSAISQNLRGFNLQSEAGRRFERGVDPNLPAIASARAVELLKGYGSAKYVGTNFVPIVQKERTIKIQMAEISNLIGFTYKTNQIKSALVKIGCKVSGGNVLTITIPSWRPDLNTVADISEEVARLNDYDLIPARLPIGKSGGGLSILQQRKRLVAQFLADNGYVETPSFPFVSAEMVKVLGFTGDRAKSFEIANPMSEQNPLLRTHLLPGLLETLIRNISRGQKNLAIFEIGSVFRNVNPKPAPNIAEGKRPNLGQLKQLYESVPKQMLFVGAVMTGNKGSGSLPNEFTWEDAVTKATEIVTTSTNDYEILNCELAPWHPGRCAEIRIAGKPVAHAGELHPRVISALNLPARTCAFAVILSELPDAKTLRPKQLSAMPAVVQDISIVVDSKIAAIDVFAEIKRNAGDLIESVDLFDRYENLQPGKVALGFTLTFRATDRTLTADEIKQFREAAVAALVKKFGAVSRST